MGKSKMGGAEKVRRGAKIIGDRNGKTRCLGFMSFDH